MLFMVVIDFVTTKYKFCIFTFYRGTLHTSLKRMTLDSLFLKIKKMSLYTEYRNL